MENEQAIEKVKDLDRNYTSKLGKFMDGLDNGTIFQSILCKLIHWGAYALVLGGLFVLIYGLIGDGGYIDRYVTGSFYRGWQKIGAIIGLVVGFTVGLLFLWLILKMFKRRAQQLSEVEFKSFMPFLYEHAIPKIIIVTGEFLFISMLYSGIMFLIATLLGSMVYAPIAGFHETIIPAFPFMDYLPNYELTMQGFKGDYNFIELGLEISLVTILTSFIVLIAFYVYREAFHYIVKLALVLVKFLPNFKIPISIKNKD